MPAQTCEQFVNLRLGLPQRLVDDALPVPVERARMVGLLADVPSQPYVDVVVSRDGPPCLPTPQSGHTDWRDAGPDTRSRHPHYDETQRFTHVNFRAGRVPISARRTSLLWRQHSPDHQRQGKKAIP